MALIIGIALIASDLLHHLLFIPLFRSHHYDLGETNHTRVHLYIYRVLGVLLIAIGLFALVTPFTPGS